MIYLFKKTVFNCQQATFLSIKRDQGTITSFERLQLAYHLFYCDPCRRFVRQSHQLDQAGWELNQSMSSQPPFTLPEPAKERIQKIIERL